MAFVHLVDLRQTVQTVSAFYRELNMLLYNGRYVAHYTPLIRDATILRQLYDEYIALASAICLGCAAAPISIVPAGMCRNKPQIADCPPSTVSAVPTQYEASSDASQRIAEAHSSAVPARPIGIWLLQYRRSSASFIT